MCRSVYGGATILVRAVSAGVMRRKRLKRLAQHSPEGRGFSSRPSFRHPEDSMTTAGSNDLDDTVDLDVNGTRQRVRLCGARAGSPPVLIVQAGPGLPLLNEVGKFQQRLQLERDFTVAYWDQRGCGRAHGRDAQTV